MICKISKNTRKLIQNFILIKKKMRHFKCPDEKLKGPTKEIIVKKREKNRNNKLCQSCEDSLRKAHPSVNMAGMALICFVQSVVTTSQTAPRCNQLLMSGDPLLSVTACPRTEQFLPEVTQGNIKGQAVDFSIPLFQYSLADATDTYPKSLQHVIYKSVNCKDLQCFVRIGSSFIFIADKIPFLFRFLVRFFIILLKRQRSGCLSCKTTIICNHRLCAFFGVFENIVSFLFFF